MLLTLALALTLSQAPPGAALIAVDSTRITEPKVDPSKPWVGRIPLTATHRRWFRELAACQRLRPYLERFDSVRLFYLNTRSLIANQLATTFPAQRQVFFVVARRHNEALVKHEFLHLLLYWNGVPDTHDQHRFTTCGVELDFDPI